MSTNQSSTEAQSSEAKNKALYDVALAQLKAKQGMDPLLVAVMERVLLEQQDAHCSAGGDARFFDLNTLQENMDVGWCTLNVFPAEFRQVYLLWKEQMAFKPDIDVSDDEAVLVMAHRKEQRDLLRTWRRQYLQPLAVTRSSLEAMAEVVRIAAPSMHHTGVAQLTFVALEKHLNCAKLWASRFGKDWEAELKAAQSPASPS